MRFFCILWFACVVSSAVQYMTNHGVSPEEVTRIVQLHNNYRGDILRGLVKLQPAAKTMPPLRYSYELAEDAQKIANRCDLVPPKDYDMSMAGQSTFYVTSTRRILCNKWNIVLEWWFMQKQFYSFYNSALPGHMAYYEIIAAYNLFVGCGYAQCRDNCTNGFAAYNNFFVCRYGRNESYLGYFPYEDKNCPGNECPVIKVTPRPCKKRCRQQ